jgi:hypothetical protein
MLTNIGRQLGVRRGEHASGEVQVLHCPPQQACCFSRLGLPAAQQPRNEAATPASRTAMASCGVIRSHTLGIARATRAGAKL